MRIAIISWLRVAVLSLAGVIGWTGIVAAAPMTLSGTVTFRERSDLPPTAVVEVKLLDVSRADAPARVVAETRMHDPGPSPVSYGLTFDSSHIEPRRTYALQARILDGDRLLFINTTRHAVFAGGPGEGDILVEYVGGKSGEPLQLAPVGRWLVEDIRGGGVLDRLQSVLEIDADGVVTGTGGCNRIRGTAVIADGRVTFGQMITTRMACTPAVMDQESKFLSALNDSRAFLVDPQRRKLFLLEASGQPVMRLSEM